MVSEATPQCLAGLFSIAPVGASLLKDQTWSQGLIPCRGLFFVIYTLFLTISDSFT